MRLGTRSVAVAAAGGPLKLSRTLRRTTVHSLVRFDAAHVGSEEHARPLEPVLRLRIARKQAGLRGARREERQQGEKVPHLE
jgi:hypothetical protein